VSTEIAAQTNTAEDRTAKRTTEGTAARSS
jgi:hypothetical protein